MLQSVLVGKACRIYPAMSIEQGSQYETVKAAILKAYKLVPEAYRQNFRRYWNQEKQPSNLLVRKKCCLTDGTLQKKLHKIS